MANTIVTDLDELDTVLRPDAVAAWATYQAGYDAYFNRRGPGVGLLRTAGWLQAWRDEQAELRQRADERSDQHQRWMY